MWRLGIWFLALLLVGFPTEGPAQQRRMLTVGSEQDFPPFAVGMTDATASGFTVELWQAVAKEQGLDYSIRVRPFAELLQDFKSKQVDVLLNLAKSDERRSFADFSATHVVVGGAIFVRSGKTGVRSEGDLAGKSLIVLKGDLAHDYALAKGWGKDLVLLDTAEQGLRLLASGKHDAMLISKLAGLQTIKEKGIQGITALDATVGFSQRFAFAVQKGDAELLAKVNEGLALVKSSGTYDRLYDKWFGPYEPRTFGWRQLWPVAVLLGLSFGAMVAFQLRNRSRAAAILRESEERWKFALEGAGEGVWDANLLTGRSLYSKRWKEILGYDENEIGDGGDEWFTRIHPEDLPRVLRENAEVLENRSDHFVSEFRMQAKDGRWVWILDRGKVVARAADGKAIRMIGTHADITVRKTADVRGAARAQVMTQIASGNLLATILDSIVRDVESRIDWRCSVVLKQGESQLVTMAARSVPPSYVAVVDSLDPDSARECFGIATPSEPRVITPDVQADAGWSSILPAANAASLRACWSELIVSDDGTVLGCFANYRDTPSSPTDDDILAMADAKQLAAIAIERKRAVQALRESEALLSAKSRTLEITLERMEQGVMMVNADRIVEVCNRRAIELLELPADLMLSKPRFEQVLEHQWSQNEFSATGTDVREFVLAGGILDKPQTYERKRPNGRTIEVQSVPLEGGGVLRTYSDISERRHAEARRHELEAQLLEARKLEAIGTLAGGIAHDFNNIMAAILGNAGLALDDLGDAHPTRRFLEQITKAGQRARSLVHQILAFSRQEPGEFTGLLLRPLIEESVSMLRSIAGPQVQILTAMSDEPLAVSGNATHVHQILMNLGTNALHSLPGGSGQVEFGLRSRMFSEGESSGSRAGLAPGSYVHVWVRDTGCGMDQEIRNHIFDPFFTSKPVGQGTGLGLAVVHGLVKTLGGVIDVSSEVGVGSTFDLFLPLSEEMAQAATTVAAIEPARGGGERIMYVDDDEVMAVMVHGLLERLGYHTTCFLDARQAIVEVVAGTAFDLVVTDFNMPDVSGLDLARELRRLRPELPVIISSGYVSEDLRASAAEAGVRVVMHKERTLEDLGVVVGVALQDRTRFV